MSSHESRRGRLGAGLLTLAAAAAATVALAAPATAAVGKGEAAIIAADHSKGRTLSGQGVKLLAGTGAVAQTGKLTLPIGELNPAATTPSATTTASLVFKRGKRSVALNAIRFDLAAGTLVGRLGDSEIPVFWLGAPPAINSVAGSIGLSAGKLRLTADAATALGEKLGLERALIRRNVGTIWLSAQASPVQHRHAVTSGSLDWGFLTSWREYIYKELGPNTVGSITTEGGATTSGEAAKPGAYFAFPASGGSYEEGLYGAPSALALKTSGSVKFAKPGHCIIEIKLSNLEVTIGPLASAIVGNLNYDIDKFNGMGCEDIPSVSAPGTTIATLATTGIAPTVAAAGKALTWANIPATLTAAAAKPFEPQYKAGQALDPVTVSVGIG
jgi:hypothetical protein